jgi:GDPmannose 4,6-dehydratase
MVKKAIITGITGQDGSYLAELLLEKGYEVYGMVRHSSNPNYWRIKHLLGKIKLIDGDLTDPSSIASAISKVMPDEFFNMAAQSFVGLSWSQPLLTTEVTGVSVLHILESIRNIKPDCKFYQASSSEMFGKVHEVPQTENTKFHPRSPYGTAKAFAHHTVVNYRESYNMYAVGGILFNHESERRGIEFVTRKITDAVARISLGKQKELRLGNLDSKRDWGHAKDYVLAAWMMLQQKEPKDYVISTDQTHTVEEFCKIAFDVVGLNYKDYVVIDPAFVRPAEVDLLLGNSSLARKELGWTPKISFNELVESMVKADLERVKLEK